MGIMSRIVGEGGALVWRGYAVRGVSLLRAGFVAPMLSKSQQSRNQVNTSSIWQADYE
jgi:hypothetical protein